VPDEELVSRLAAGGHEALDPLQERYGSVLTSLASRQLNRPSAEEIVQARAAGNNQNSHPRLRPMTH